MPANAGTRLSVVVMMVMMVAVRWLGHGESACAESQQQNPGKVP